MSGHETIWRHHPELAQVAGDERVAVLSLRELARRPAIFEGTGAAIWVLMANGRTIEQAVADLAPRFDADPDLIRANVSSFVQELAGLGLLVRDGDG